MKRWAGLTRLWLVVAAAGQLQAADWPQWRGLNRTGFSPERLGTNWPAAGPKLLWQAKVGTGFSSVSVAEGRAYAFGNTTNQDALWCFNARSGRRLWVHSYPARLDPQWYEGGPGATPTVNEGRVFTLSKWGDVFCLDARSGTVVWKRDLRQDGLRPPRWGYAGSPLVWSNLVLLNAGACGTALDKRTGNLVWSTGTNASGYASPVVVKLNDRPSLLIFAAKHLVCLEPRTGREYWRVPWETGWDTNITDPVAQDGTVFISSFSRGCALLDVSGAQPRMLYESKVLYNHLSPGIRVGDYLYAFSGEAKTETDFRCIHVPSGSLQWQTRDPSFGSLLSADGKLLVLSGKGDLLLVQPTPAKFEPLARAHVLPGACWTPPALANGRLYIRNAKGDLRCLELPAR